MASALVLSERRDNVLLLTLNRPDRLNAWTDELEACYFALLQRAEADPEIRAVVVTGAGRGFCAGADLDFMKTTADDRGLAEDPNRRPRSYPLSLRLPVVAAINGAAIGLGLVEALYCDIRFATSSAKLGTAFAQRGLIAEYGASWILPRLIGQGAALDLLLSARIIRGQEALAMGLINRLCEPERLVDDAVAYAQGLATHCSPASMATIKHQVQQHLSASFAEAVCESDELMAQAFQHPDAQEGIASYLERRPPQFAALTT